MYDKNLTNIEVILNKEYKILNKDVILNHKVIEKKSSKISQAKNCPEKSYSEEESEELLSENNNENEKILAGEMNFEGCVFPKESQPLQGQSPLEEDPENEAEKNMSEQVKNT